MLVEIYIFFLPLCRSARCVFLCICHQLETACSLTSTPLHFQCNENLEKLLAGSHGGFFSSTLPRRHLGLTSPSVNQSNQFVVRWGWQKRKIEKPIGFHQRRRRRWKVTLLFVFSSSPAFQNAMKLEAHRLIAPCYRRRLVVWDGWRGGLSSLHSSAVDVI